MTSFEYASNVILRQSALSGVIQKGFLSSCNLVLWNPRKYLVTVRFPFTLSGFSMLHSGRSSKVNRVNALHQVVLCYTSERSQRSNVRL
jgi:hypothetical protein